MAYPLEALLRPAYELRAAAISALAAAAVVWSPSTFMLTPELAWGFAGVFCCHAAWRSTAGLKIVRYRANLRRQRRYRVTSEEIPWSHDRLFLGRGFQWDQRHTQRLQEARLPEKRDLLQAGLLRRIADLLASQAPVQLGVGGDAAIHGVEPAESDIWMDVAERVGHTLVLGTTRVGKTRLAEVLLTQDIRRGEVVIVFDPKGDIDLLRRVYAEAKRAGRHQEFFLFHLGHPEISARYNPVGNFSRITEVATRIAGQLPSEGQSAAFKEFVWRFVNVMARALVALGRKPDYEQINRYAANIEPLLVHYFEHWLDREPAAKGWRAEVEAMAIDKRSLDKGLQSRGARAVTLVEYARRKKLYDPLANALASTLNYEKSYFDKLVASLLPLMEKLTTGRIASLLSPVYDDPTDWRPVFDWTSIIHLRGIVYIGLDALSDYEVAAAVGNSMFADLTSVAGSLYKFGTGRGLPGMTGERRIAIHADEFNELIGEEFIPLLNKAGGAGFQVTAYTQTWSDIEARIGSKPKAGQIAGNFNNLIMLRVKEMATAELLTDQLPEVRIVSTTTSSSVSDTNDPGDFADFASRNEDRITTESAPLLAPSDLVQLPKGQAFALIQGGQLYKIRIPLPDGSHDALMAENLVAVGNEIKSRFGMPTGSHCVLGTNIGNASGL
jgi:conjugative coupling factor TraD (TOL family)